MTRSSIQNIYNDHCFYAPAFLVWFAFSAFLSSFNKVIFGNDHMAFPCPLLITSIHFLIQWAFSYIITAYVFPIPLGGDIVSSMPWKVYLLTSIPCGLITAFDVGLSNVSLVRITITFYTMVKASSPIFVLISAYFLGIERITISLLMIVLIIAAGEFLTVVGEVDFDLIGFLTCLAASIMAGMRWTVVQHRLNSLDPPLKSTLATMRVLSPVMFIAMAFLSICIERPWVKLNGYFHSAVHFWSILGLAAIGGTIAVIMISCEFYLIMKSNAIVLMIGGVMKEMVTILIGVKLFGDTINAINAAGISVVFLGVFLYKVSYHMAKMQREQLNGADIEDYDTVISPSSNIDHGKDGQEGEDLSAASVSNGSFHLYSIDDDDDDDAVEGGMSFEIEKKQKDKFFDDGSNASVI
mmetsp:Transcript_23609/g.35219  ORF Transcript_23609/g.35219 Transcript_23609/m.35219 type:complete len:410 (-) Transcript_23609:909-2138(-)